MQYAKTAESRGKTARIERIFGTMGTAPNGVGSTGRGLTTMTVRSHEMAESQRTQSGRTTRNPPKRNAGGES